MDGLIVCELRNLIHLRAGRAPWIIRRGLPHFGLRVRVAFRVILGHPDGPFREMLHPVTVVRAKRSMQAPMPNIADAPNDSLVDSTGTYHIQNPCNLPE